MNIKIQRTALRPFGLGPLLLAAALVSSVRPLAGQSIVQSWEGMREAVNIPAGYRPVPPDPHGAPGPAGVLATVNLAISYYSKSGAVRWGPVAFTNFFVANAGVTNQNADPRAIFDAYSRRFFVIMQENHNSTFWLDVAVSKNSDPQSSGATDWATYRLNATRLGPNGAGGVNYACDYPGLAVDSQALYVTYGEFPFNTAGVLSGGATNSVLLILDKAALISGSPTVARLDLNDTGLRPHPVTPVGYAPPNVMYMVANWNTNKLKVYAVGDPLGARTLQSKIITVTDVGLGPSANAPQTNSANLVGTLAGQMQGNATLVGDDLWCCATRGQAAGPAVAAWWRLRLNRWPLGGPDPTLAEEGTVGAPTDWNFIPSISANLQGDVAITWTRSSSSRYPAMMCAWRTAADTAFAASVLVTSANLGPDNDVTAPGSGQARWGDYFSSWPDPSDGSFWVVSEWIRADTGKWSTWWAQISMPGRIFYVNRNSPTPGVEDGSLAHPYTSVTTAQSYLASGIINIYGGHYNEQPTLNKALTLQPYCCGGYVTIGAP